MWTAFSCGVKNTYISTDEALYVSYVPPRVSWWYYHSHLCKTEWFPEPKTFILPLPLMPEKPLLYLTATVWEREDVRLCSSLCSSLKCNGIFHLHRSHSHSQDIALNMYLLLHMEGKFQTVIMCVRLTVQLEIGVVSVESMSVLHFVPSHSPLWQGALRKSFECPVYNEYLFLF